RKPRRARPGAVRQTRRSRVAQALPWRFLIHKSHEGVPFRERPRAFQSNRSGEWFGLLFPIVQPVAGRRGSAQHRRNPSRGSGFRGSGFRSAGFAFRLASRAARPFLGGPCSVCLALLLRRFTSRLFGGLGFFGAFFLLGSHGEVSACPSSSPSCQQPSSWSWSS